MQFAEVIGQVIATRKEGRTHGLKIMVVRYLDEAMQATKKTAACIDTVSAGRGDIVLLCSSSSARMTKMTKGVCTDNTIVGIIDSVTAPGKIIYEKESNK